MNSTYSKSIRSNLSKNLKSSTTNDSKKYGSKTEDAVIKTEGANKYSGDYQGITKKKINKYSKLNIMKKKVAQPKLEKSKDGWKLKKPEEMNNKEKIKLQVNDWANKLSESNYERILHHFLALEVNDLETIKLVSKTLFDKAISEKMYCSIYAKLCNDLKNKYRVQDKKITLKTVLYNLFQTEFERKISESPKNEDYNLEEWNFKEKQKKIGNVSFIAELFKLKMVEESIILSCIKNLLSERSDENIELICKLLSICGKELEISKLELFNSILQELEEISSKESMRLRFMVMDLKLLRENNWVSLIKQSKPEKSISSLVKDLPQVASPNPLSSPSSKKIIVANKRQDISQTKYAQSTQRETVNENIDFSNKIRQNFLEFFENQDLEEFEYSLSKDFKKDQFPKVFSQSMFLFSDSPNKYKQVIELLFEKFSSLIDRNFVISYFDHFSDSYPLFFEDYPNLVDPFAFSLSQFFISFPRLVNSTFFTNKMFLTLRDYPTLKKQPFDFMGASSVLFVKFCENLLEENKQHLLDSILNNKSFLIQQVLKSNSNKNHLCSFRNHFKFLEKLF